jgi:hypothetical protein
MASQREELYHKYPFTEAAGQIRLLKLNPSESPDTIEANMAVVDLETVPRFAAISYTWGASHPTKTIHIVNISVEVGENCWYALWQARKNRPDTWVWIDAICIDQANMAEKKLQVWRMGRLYASAERVCVSFGHGGDDCDKIVDTLRRLKSGEMVLDPLRRRRPFYSSDDYSADDHSADYMWRSQRQKQWSNILQDSGDLSSLLLAHRSFIERPYWGRLWVVQEVILANIVEAWCGQYVIPWNSLIDFLEACRLISSDTERNDPLVWAPMYLDDLRRERQRGRRIPLDNFFKMLSSKKCFDPRDRIYGALELTGWTGGFELLIPYYTLRLHGLAIKVISLLRFDPFFRSETAEFDEVYEGKAIIPGRDWFSNALWVMGLLDLTYEDPQIRMSVELRTECTSVDFARVPKRSNTYSQGMQWTLVQSMDGGLAKPVLHGCYSTKTNILDIPETSITNSSMVPIYHGDRIAGWSNCELLGGDVLVSVTPDNNALSYDNCQAALVIRPTVSSLRCEIVGHAILWNGYKLLQRRYPMCECAPPSISNRTLELCMDVEDLIVFTAHARRSSEPWSIAQIQRRLAIPFTKHLFSSWAELT